MENQNWKLRRGACSGGHKHWAKGFGPHSLGTGSQSRCHRTQRVREGISALLEGVKGQEEEHGVGVGNSGPLALLQTE